MIKVTKSNAQKNKYARKKNNYMHKKSLKIPRKQMRRNSDEYVKIVIKSQL